MEEQGAGETGWVNALQLCYFEGSPFQAWKSNVSKNTSQTYFDRSFFITQQSYIMNKNEFAWLYQLRLFRHESSQPPFSH